MTQPDVAAMVREFHEAFRCAVAEPDSLTLREKRATLIAEESVEAYDALRVEAPLTAVAKELADLVYVAYGTAIALGFDLDHAVRLVHESNMSKLGPDGRPIVRSDGKVLKGPNYREPDMTEVVRSSGTRGEGETHG